MLVLLAMWFGCGSEAHNRRANHYGGLKKKIQTKKTDSNSTTGTTVVSMWLVCVQKLTTATLPAKGAKEERLRGFLWGGTHAVAGTVGGHLYAARIFSMSLAEGSSCVV